MSAYTDGTEAAVVLVLAVVGAGRDRAGNGVVGGAAAAVVGTGLVHRFVLLWKE